VTALGGYELTSREVSLLNDDQKTALNNLGTNIAGKAGNALTETLTGLVQKGLIAPDMAQQIGGMFTNLSAPLAQALDGVGSSVRQSFRTNNRNMMGASVMVTQPIYMGGAITAANRLADLGEKMSATKYELARQTTIYDIDQAYWLVVSVKHKERLARNYLELVKKFDSDVDKMFNEGVATRADALQVDVKVNEAEMQVMQAEDGVALAKMLLCQLCGMPCEENITLADEDTENLALPMYDEGREVTNYDNRPEVQMLQTAVDMTKASTKLARATYLPQVMATGGYLVTNPNLYNGFEKKFGGVWNVGVVVRVPVWNWGDVKYKVRASKGATAMANLELDDAREMISLQVRQNNFKVKEAQKKLTMAQSNVANADENLRMANLAFKEGTASFTTVMEAQTAWNAAQSQLIDAEIGVKLSEVELQKALGTLR
jgi:outer membrane protein TolC